MDAKQLLLKQTRDAYRDCGEMSLHAAIKDLTNDQAAWRMNPTTATIVEILIHTAKCKIIYCKEAFNKWPRDYEKPADDNLQNAIEQLDEIQAHLESCLEEISLGDLEKPLPIQCHGETAAHFFSVMIRHDLVHAGQINMIRNAHTPPPGDAHYGPYSDAKE